MLEEASAKAAHKNLRTCLKAGVAFHHSALDPSDRLLVEQLFLDQTIRVLFATTTCVFPSCSPSYHLIVSPSPSLRGVACAGRMADWRKG